MYITSNLLVKAILYTPLIGRLGTLEPKGHRHIAEGSKGSDERRLLLVLNCHFDLMITGICIQKDQTLATRRSINNLINTGEGKRICWTSFVEIYVVHTHTPTVVLLKHQHRISQPLRMEYFNDKSSRQEPGYFFTNSLVSFLIEPAKKLLD